jgi:peptidoglycan/xylan/chitin deacetylase (PgdA/CDA1 family)
MPDEVDIRTFNAQMSALRACFNVLPLAEAIERLKARALPARAACVSFDDGYADNIGNALPILCRCGIPATFFIATGFLDGGRMWNDTVIEAIRHAPDPVLDLTPIQMGIYPLRDAVERRAAVHTLIPQLKYLPSAERLERVAQIAELSGADLPTNLMMTSQQIRDLHAAGMEIGGHTVTHPILSCLDMPRAREEIANGKAALEHLIDAPVRLFAYPNGKPRQDYLLDHVNLVKEVGFDAAVSTAWGVAHPGSDYFQLPRFTPWYKDPSWFVLGMLRNCLNTNADTVY